MLRDTMVEWLSRTNLDVVPPLRAAHAIDARVWSETAYETMDALIDGKNGQLLDILRGLPACRPPLPETFVELQRWGLKVGVYFRESTPSAVEACLGRKMEAGFWERGPMMTHTAEVWAMWPDPEYGHSLARLPRLRTLSIDRDGIIQRDTVHRLGALSVQPRSSQVIGSAPWDEEKRDETRNQMVSVSQAAMYAALFALALMHAPGTELVEVTPSAPLNRARARRGKAPLLRYYVLDLAVPKTRGTSTTTGVSGDDPEPRALHIVRGHYLHYHGLKKWRGAFWRGDPAHGVIIKDYRLAVAKPALAEAAIARTEE